MINKQTTEQPNETHTKQFGSVFDIQRFSIHDGPGIRTTVFLKGCPLSCKWCHNPESQKLTTEIAFYLHKCIGCGRCADACVNMAIQSSEQRINRELCQKCGKCADVCPAEALRSIGKIQSADEVMAVVMRDEPFYKTSNGGITISGGEPLYQHDFTVSLLKASKANKLHTAVETSGFAPWERLQELSEWTDLFLYDIKVIDNQKHKSLCGVNNKLILENAEKLAAAGKNIIFRTPIIPKCNDSEKDIKELGDFILSLPGSQKLELMAYHKIGSGKYEAIGRTYTLPDIDAPDSMDVYKDQLIVMGVSLITE